jgi:membrane-bound inhibitor of C-type lysozyme
MKTLLLGSLLLTTAGCATAPATPETREIAFACGNGETMTVRFSDAPPQAVLVRNGSEFVLPQQPSGSGFRYGDARHAIRGKGDALTVEIGRMAPIQCTAQRG